MSDLVIRVTRLIKIVRYAIGTRLFLSKVPLEVLQNWVLIQLIVAPHILGKVQGQIKEVCRLIESCLLIGTRE